MEEKKARKKLSLAKAVEQGGFYHPLTTEQEASNLNLSGKFVRSSLSLGHSIPDERLFATRNGLIPAFSTLPHNSYSCIQQRKRLISRLKAQLTSVDKQLAMTGMGRYKAKRWVEEEEKEFFLTGMDTEFEGNSEINIEKTAEKQPISTSFSSKLPPLAPSQHGLKKSLMYFKRAKSEISPRTRLSSINSQCDSISQSISATKADLSRETQAVQAQYALNLRHLKVLEIAKRRWKYYSLRKTFQTDTKVS
jgi:hypothetical protein